MIPCPVKDQGRQFDIGDLAAIVETIFFPHVESVEADPQRHAALNATLAFFARY